MSDGQTINVHATSSEECQSGADNVACDDGMLSMSQTQMVDTFSDFGYMPQDDDLLWASPYSTYDFDDYSYDNAEDESDIAKRTYESCNDDGLCADVHDLSYVVEQFPGYLFLCIDCDV